MDYVEQIGGWVLEEEARRSQWRTAVDRQADDPALRAMLKRRRDFELMLGEHPEDLTSHQRARAWELADSDPWPDRMTEDETRECMGLARYL